MRIINAFFIRLFLVVALAAMTACGTHAPLHRAVPESQVSNAHLVGFPEGIRSWSDEPGAGLAHAIEKRIDQYRASHDEYFKDHGTYPPMSYLALSGGSNNGAYGAGVLYGWTGSGTRPEFAVVTGVSTGALIAPFAFLGSQYDEVIRREYTTVRSENIFTGGLWTVLRGVTGGMALVDNSPLRQRIDEIITPKIFAEIAAEHRKGRRLLIITTNMEAQRGVIWSIGSIANSGTPGALELFKKILLASAAVPGLFEPVLIDVTVGGQDYQEIHADGGVTSQVFLFPLKSTRVDRDAFVAAKIRRDLYVIRNGKIAPEYEELKPAALSLSQRSVETLIKYQGIGDLYRIYAGAMRDGMNFHVTYIPSTFNEQPMELFDPAYMSKLFDLGYQRMRKDNLWETTPPGMAYVD